MTIEIDQVNKSIKKIKDKKKILSYLDSLLHITRSELELEKVKFDSNNIAVKISKDDINGLITLHNNLIDIKNIQSNYLSYDEFTKVDMRVGKIVGVEPFPKARKPSYILKINFGDQIGIRESSAQITQLYSREDLIGKQVVGVINFPKKQIANFFSESLTLGVEDVDSNVILLTTDIDAPLGARIF